MSTPFSKWRFSAYLPGDEVVEIDPSSITHPGMVFDELVVDCAPGIVHVEVMDDAPPHLWMNVCGVVLNVFPKDKGIIVEDETEDGWEMELLW